jgi:hypothetical protein
LLEAHVNIIFPPQSIDPIDAGNPFIVEYRQTSYVLMACMSGCLESLKLLKQRGASLIEDGFIGFSPKYRNMVRSSSIACAAFYDCTQVLSYLFS